MTDSPPKSPPPRLRWTGSLAAGLAVATVVLLLGLSEQGERADTRRVEESRIAAAVAARIRTEADLSPTSLAVFETLSGATIVARGIDRTTTARGVETATRATRGVPVPLLPGWRIDAQLPEAEPESVVWLEAGLAGLFAAVATWLATLRMRRDARRLRRDLDGLVRQESDPHAGNRRRVSVPETPIMADAVRPLNELLVVLSARLTEFERGRARQNLVFESMASGVLVLDADGSIDSVNPAARRLLEISQVSPRGLRLSEAVQESDIHDMVAKAISARRLERRVFRSARSSPDHERELATAVAPIVDRRMERESDGLGGVVILVEDATYLRRLERARTEFVGNVSHELRTPITNLLGYLDTTLDLGPEDEETRERFLRIAQRNAKRLASIIEDLLALATLEAPGESLERDPVRLRPLLDRIAERHRVELGEDPRRLAVDCAPELEIAGIATLLDQAVENLVSNALRYGSAEGRVLIEGRREDGVVSISVADDGPGISPRHLPRIFERFYRVDAARSRQEGGTGLGLAIVKHIAAAHGGTVDVESMVGIGSRFTIRIPDDPDAGPGADDATRTPSEATPGFDDEN